MSSKTRKKIPIKVWMTDNKKIYREKHPELSLKEINQFMIESWETLDNEIHQKFEKICKKLNNETSESEDDIPEDKQIIMFETIRTRSSFDIYVSEHIYNYKLKYKYSNVKIKNILRDEWNLLENKKEWDNKERNEYELFNS